MSANFRSSFTNADASKLNSDWSTWFGSGRKQAAAREFLETGSFKGFYAGTPCWNSDWCASGFACVGGICVEKASETSSGTSDCGDGSDGKCTASSSSGADGCTTSSCEGGSCDSSDCPGERTCRFDAFGTVNCYCGTPEQQGCSSFCTAYQQSNGESSDGCSGLACDECSYCDEIYVAATGICTPNNDCNSPAHCWGSNSNCLDDCEYVTEEGEVKYDETNCYKCVERVAVQCSCGTFTNSCCYSISDWNKTGKSPVNRCAESFNCSQVCPPQTTPSIVPADPCAGTYSSSSTRCSAGGSCPPDLTDIVPGRPTAPNGQRYEYTGCIEANGEACWLYNVYDMSDLPDECKQCDCNCHNDCPECELCGSDGKCYPDPNCPTSGRTVWQVCQPAYTYWGCSYSPTSGAGGCVNPSNVPAGCATITTNAGKFPHKAVMVGVPDLIPFGPCVSGWSATRWRIQDADGNWVSSEFSVGAVSGTYCGGPPTPGDSPVIMQVLT